MALYGGTGASPDSAARRRKKKSPFSGSGNTGLERSDEDRAERRAARSPRDAPVGDSGGGAARSPRQTGRARPGGGVTGGSAPPLAAAPTNVPNSALGREYDLTTFGNDLFANPQLITQSYLENQGVNTLEGGGLPRVYEDLARQLPQLFYLTQGMGGPDSSGFSSFLDYADSYLNQMAQPGAGVLDPSVVGNIFDAGKGSSIHALLNDPNADPQSQANALLGLMAAGLGAGMPGPLATAYMGQAQGLSDQWLNQTMKGKKGQTFADYLEQEGFDDLFR